VADHQVVLQLRQLVLGDRHFGEGPEAGVDSVDCPVAVGDALDQVAAGLHALRGVAAQHHLGAVSHRREMLQGEGEPV